jgi:hypothetical protein
VKKSCGQRSLYSTASAAVDFHINHFGAGFSNIGGGQKNYRRVRGLALSLCVCLFLNHGSLFLGQSIYRRSNKTRKYYVNAGRGGFGVHPRHVQGGDIPEYGRSYPIESHCL